MKYFLTICFSCVLSSLSAQKITFKPVFINQFTNEVEKEVSYCLTRDSLTYHSLFGENIQLLNSGIYRLLYDCYSTGYAMDIFISEDDFIDTFYLPKLSFSMLVSNPPVTYWNFTNKEGSLANGKVIDYYYNGQIRMEGQFKEGQPKGDLVFYYENGQTKQIESNRKQIDYSYYKNGQLKEVRNYKRNRFKDYYPNGQLKEFTQYNKRYKVINEKVYFENGQLCSEQKRNNYKKFDNQGRMMYKTSRKESFVLSRIYEQIFHNDNDRYYIYTLTEFEKNSNKTVVYHYTEFENSKYNFLSLEDLKFVEGFKHITFYEKDKVILELKIALDLANKIEDYANIPSAIYKKENDEWKYIKTVFDVEIYDEIQRLKLEVYKSL